MIVRARLAKIAKAVGLVALDVVVVLGAAWGALLLAYAGPEQGTIRIACVAAFCLASAGVTIGLLVPGMRSRAATGLVILCLPLVAVWMSMQPSNDRNWQPDVAVLAYATFDGERITVHNIRNFEYRSESDFTVRYYDRQFDLQQLRSVDLVTSYWMGPAIAHLLVSFGFEGDEYLAISIEVRKARGNAYSALKGFFRQYELVYVVADERDVIRLRTNYRRNPPESVYVYRLVGSKEAGQRLFMEYMERLNALRVHPEFYNTLTTNCATSIWMNAHVNSFRVPLDWRIIASGYVPEYLYSEHRLVDDNLSFPDLQRRSNINARAEAAGSAPDFSRKIRDWGVAHEN